MSKSARISWQPFSEKHKAYIRDGLDRRMCVAEGAIRSGKTIDHCIMAAAYLETCSDRFHLASGSTIGNAKLNIGVCNGFGLEALFRGRCRWGKYRDNEALYIDTKTGEKIVIFTGGAKADSYKRILGNSYGLWIATEINEHYDSEDSRTSFIKVANGRQLAAVQPYTLWDLNPCSPNNTVYKWYVDNYLPQPWYQYEHFTIHDNLSISAERIAEIEKQYIPGTVWYRRDILGERCVAEGLIYDGFANNPAAFILDMDAEKKHIPVVCHIGVDFGGNGSAHAFTCTGFTYGYREMVCLEEYYRKEIISPTQLENDFVAFAKMCQSRYTVADAYCDSAEQTLMQGLRNACARNHVPINILNAAKNPINERIRCLCRMIAGGRFFITKRCAATIDALQSAVWDAKHITEDVRLDDGTTNIDSLDSLEYSFERRIRELINAR